MRDIRAALAYKDGCQGVFPHWEVGLVHSKCSSQVKRYKKRASHRPARPKTVKNVKEVQRGNKADRNVTQKNLRLRAEFRKSCFASPLAFDVVCLRAFSV
jgi:hypothetical protein